MPVATARNPVSREPGSAWLAANPSMARDISVGTTRLSAFAATVSATIVATSGAYGFRRPVSRGPAFRTGPFGGDVEAKRSFSFSRTAPSMRVSCAA